MVSRGMKSVIKILKECREDAIKKRINDSRAALDQYRVGLILVR